MNRVTNAEGIFSGGNTPAGRDGARPSGAEAQKNKKSEGRIRFSAAFTLIELIIVIGIIVFLAGLILAVSGYVQEKGKRARAEAEIAAMSAALESYKADNGIYPRGNANLGVSTPYDTDQLDARASLDPASYNSASLFLYKALSGDTNANLQPPAGARTYFSFNPRMLSGSRDSNGNLISVTYIRDPFGSNPPHSYGYSTANQLDLAKGYNPTFDLWSNGVPTPTPSPAPTPTPQDKWIKNW